MTVIALVLNALLLIFWLVIMIAEGGPGDMLWAWIFCGLLFVCPVVNITVLLCSWPKTWLAILFERKKLEERKRIAALKAELADI